MFRGVNQLNLDTKGRLTFPTRYRERLQSRSEGEVIVTVDPSDPCLLVYDLSEWEVIERKLVAMPNVNKAVRRLQRILIGYASECTMDSNGRIVVQPTLREFAGLEKKVVLVGQGKKFELWDEVKWNEQRDVWLAEPSDESDMSAQLEELSL